MAKKNYRRQIREVHNMNRRIYYTDETWINEGHTVLKVRYDGNIQSKRQAFLQGFSTRLKSLSGKGQRLIISHIESTTEFLKHGLLVFQSRRTGDYREDIDSNVFEKWFKSVLPHMEPESVVVMDNAPFHSRQKEKLPTSAWRKAEIIDWLKLKNIHFDETMLKTELLKIAQREKDQYIKYSNSFSDDSGSDSASEQC